MSRDGLVEQNRANGRRTADQRQAGRCFLWKRTHGGYRPGAFRESPRQPVLRPGLSWPGKAFAGAGGKVRKPGGNCGKRTGGAGPAGRTGGAGRQRQPQPGTIETGRKAPCRPSKEVSGKGRLRFEKDEDSREIPETRSKSRARQPVKKEGAAGSEGKTRLQFEPEERAQKGETGETEEAGAAQKETPREKKRYEKAQQRVEKIRPEAEKGPGKTSHPPPDHIGKAV